MSDPIAAAIASLHFDLDQKNGDATAKEALPIMKPPRRTTIQVLTFADPTTSELSWMAIGTCKRKFRAFLTFVKAIETTSSISNSAIQSQALSIPDGPGSPVDEENKTEKDTIWLSWEESLELKKKMRELWEARRLLTTDTSWVKERKTASNSSNNNAAYANLKRGSFEDKLWFQVERFEEILLDEKEAIPEQSLLVWLSENYGEKDMLYLQADTFRELTSDTQLKVLHHFMDWFRSVFPYYYDRCLHCGKSLKNDRAKGEVQDEKQDDDDNDDDGGVYLGQAQPSEDELQTGKASRVEVFQCHKCKCVYDFPRFNAAWSIVQTKRGRCGEYSILLYRMLRALGHADTTRYVVDWADHVWCEVRRQTTPDGGGSVEPKYEWIHLDPCEAAVDNPLLYQSWGKKPTYLVALFAPSFEKGGDSLTHHTKVPFIEDVTSKYTSDSLYVINERRRAGGESEDSVRQAIVRWDRLLETQLAKFSNGN